MQTAASLYVHIPFCATKCYYCAFNTHPFHKEQAQTYLDALRREMVFYASACSPLRTVFLGGGTPSILSPNSLEELFSALHTHFRILPDAEMTVECNPGTVDCEKLAVMRAFGVNRLSFGVQAMNDATLRQLGRIHRVGEVHRSVQLARDADFDNINLDLIFALPDQAIAEWKHSLQEVMALTPEHISTYNLMVEKGTAFYDWWEAGTLKLLDNDTEAEMFEVTIETLTNLGYEHYEISNFALPSRAAKHNLVYWNNEPYIGLGVSACGYLDGLRYTNIRGIVDYIDCLERGEKPIDSSEHLTGREEKAETIILALRKREGICQQDYQRRFGESIETEFGDILEKWMALKLLKWKDSHLRLTDQGIFLANEVFVDFL